MNIAAGTRLGPYQIVAHLGAGGMGTVYRARDTRLSRDVALKLLPSWASSDARMRERLSREARAISALSHPNICRLFDVGSTDGVDYLVMELLDGESLAERLARGPLSSEEALRIAGEIALALDAAHRAGIVHRDLKPANVMLTANGARLVDFGLARVLAGGDADAGAPTQPKPLTQEGIMVGTLRYMAPEQVEGRKVDTRTDVFAFGLVLYEMLAGRPAFPATSQAALIASIITAEPPPLRSPAGRVVRRCLKKNPDERWQSMEAVAEALRWAGESGEESVIVRRRPSWIVPAAIAVIIAAALLGWARSRGRQATNAPPRPIRFSVYPPQGTTLGQGPVESEFALSPDGRLLAFVAHEGRRYKLFVRALDVLAARALDGTENAVGVFWSPDAKWIAFFADGFLKKIPVDGGPVQTICPVQGGHGSWSPNGNIFFFSWGENASEAVQVVRESGGTPREVTNAKLGWDMWPAFLPDGRHFLFYRLAPPSGSSGIFVGSIDGGEERKVMNVASAGRFSNGDLYYARDATLYRQHFDLKRFTVDGEPVPVGQDVFNFTLTGSSSFSVSDDGRTIAWERSALPTQLVWRDFSGRQLGRVGGPELYRSFAISPDGHRIAADIFDRKTQVTDIWMIDADRGVRTRVTPGLTIYSTPVWMHHTDGLIISMGDPQNPARAPDLAMLTLADGTTRRILRTEGVTFPSSITADDAHVIFTRNRGQRRQMQMLTVADAAVVDLGNAGRNEEGEPNVSPDQRWLAYESDESGRPEVYVQPFGRKGPKVPISTDGGREPQWAPDGKAVFFINRDSNLVKADVESAERLHVLGATVLFPVSSAGMLEFDSLGLHHYAVAGDRILVRELPGDVDPLTVLLNMR